MISRLEGNGKESERRKIIKFLHFLVSKWRLILFEANLSKCKLFGQLREIPALLKVVLSLQMSFKKTYLFYDPQWLLHARHKPSYSRYVCHSGIRERLLSTMDRISITISRSPNQMEVWESPSSYCRSKCFGSYVSPTALVLQWRISRKTSHKPLPTSAPLLQFTDTQSITLKVLNSLVLVRTPR